MPSFIGSIVSAERIPTKANPQKSFYKIKASPKEGGSSIELSTWDAKVMDLGGKTCELNYEVKMNGKWENKNLLDWTVLPASQQAAAASMPSQGGAVAGVAAFAFADPKQENINRQSAWNAAIQLVNTCLQGGFSIIPSTAETGVKGRPKKDAKDPEVIFMWVQEWTRRIKDDVQNGEWTNKWKATAVEAKPAAEPAEGEPAAPSDDDIPF